MNKSDTRYVSKIGRQFLTLMQVTGGWALPERGGMWRGKDQSRLHMNGKPFKDILAVSKLHKQGLLEKLSAADVSKNCPEFKNVPWFSERRPVYRLTEAGEKERLGYDAEKDAQNFLITAPISTISMVGS